MFPVKLTEPLTAILYIAFDKEHIEELKHAIHVKEVVEGTFIHHTVFGLAIHMTSNQIFILSTSSCTRTSRDCFTQARPPARRFAGVLLGFHFCNYHCVSHIPMQADYQRILRAARKTKISL